MATINLSDSSLSIRLTRGEKVAGFLRDLDVPLSGVTAVTLEQDAVHATRGIRAPGLGLPGHRLIGTWRGRDYKAYVSVKREVPALRVELAGQKYDELLVSHPDAAALAEQLRGRIAARS